MSKGLRQEHNDLIRLAKSHEEIASDLRFEDAENLARRWCELYPRLVERGQIAKYVSANNRFAFYDLSQFKPDMNHSITIADGSAEVKIDLYIRDNSETNRQGLPYFSVVLPASLWWNTPTSEDE